MNAPLCSGDVDAKYTKVQLDNGVEATMPTLGEYRVCGENIDRLGIVANVTYSKDCCEKCQKTYWDTEIFDHERLYDGSVQSGACHCAKTNKWKTGKRVSTTRAGTEFMFSGLCGKYALKH